jgi:hypothetical protein
MNVLESKTNEEVYLEWLNDFLTIQTMADNYGMPSGELEIIINRGRNEHLQKFESEAYKKIWLPKN